MDDGKRKISKINIIGLASAIAYFVLMTIFIFTTYDEVNLGITDEELKDENYSLYLFYDDLTDKQKELFNEPGKHLFVIKNEDITLFWRINVKDTVAPEVSLKSKVLYRNEKVDYKELLRIRDNSSGNFDDFIITTIYEPDLSKDKTTFKIKVTDKNGNSTVDEFDVEVKERYYSVIDYLSEIAKSLSTYSAFLDTSKDELLIQYKYKQKDSTYLFYHHLYSGYVNLTAGTGYSSDEEIGSDDGKFWGSEKYSYKFDKMGNITEETKVKKYSWGSEDIDKYFKGDYGLKDPAFKTATMNSIDSEVLGLLYGKKVSELDNYKIDLKTLTLVQK